MLRHSIDANLYAFILNILMRRILGRLSVSSPYDVVRPCSISPGTFLVSNYKQALDILATAPDAYSHFPPKTDFQQWLDEEYQYLDSKKSTLPNEEFKIEYYKLLVSLNDVRYVSLHPDQLGAHTANRESLNTSQRLFIAYDPQAQGNKATSLERARRHALEKESRLIDRIQALENKQDIAVRWIPESAEWKEAASLASMHRYQKALDKLEGLVVARLFELTKMNMSRTSGWLNFLCMDILKCT